MNSLCRQIATDKTKNNINMLHDMNNVLVSRPNLILDQHIMSPDPVSQNISSTAQLAEPAGRALLTR